MIYLGTFLNTRTRIILLRRNNNRYKILLSKFLNLKQKGVKQ